VAVASIEETLEGCSLKRGRAPMYFFPDLLKTPVVGLPIVNHGNDHGANENLRLQNLWDETDVFAGVLTGAKGNWK
jgi:acetylornithine deacetylase/succinyl-diaminopimelate desuccinylase-like protein